jgi:trehalose 2-sulfotransferase
VQPQLSYLVCSVERTGSTLFCQLLDSMNIAGHPAVEYFKAAEEVRAHQEQTFPKFSDYLAYVRAQTTTDNDVLGSRIMWTHMPNILAKMQQESPNLSDIELFQQAFPSLKHFIFTYRKDIVEQAVSWAIAVQTGQWKSDAAPSNTESIYNFALIDLLYREVQAHNLAWERWFQCFGIEPLRVEYEDLVYNPSGVVRKALQFLGIEAPNQLLLEAANAKQGNACNQEWKQRYLAESAGRYIRPEQYRD